MANMVDKAVAYFWPDKAAKRAAARKALSVIDSGYGNYGANLTKRSMRSWNYHGGSAREDIEDNLDVLRQRSRDAYMGIPIAAGMIKTMRTNVVCSGLVPTPQIDTDFLGLDEKRADELQAQIVREFRLWADSPACDADGIDNFWNLQRLAYIGYLMNGDAFAVLPYEEQPWKPYGLEVQLIEADRVCSPDGYDRLAPCTVNGHKVWQIVQGVETDKTGRVVAYWICNHHPLARLDSTPMEWQRVEARGKETSRRNILHIMKRERAGQLRGVPLLAPVLESLKQLGRYTEAEIDAAMVAAMVTVMIEKESPSDTAPFGQVPPSAASDPNAPPDALGIELAPAAIFDLAPGEKANMLDPKHPTTTFDGFVTAEAKQMGAGTEIPIEVLFKNFSNNYSASRGALNEFWRTCDMERSGFADSFCQPIYETFFAEAVARGRINAPGFFSDPAIAKAYLGCRWNGPARTNLDAKKEIEAAILRIESGISTAEQETAQMTGGSYAANMRQRKREIEKMREAGADGERHQFPNEGEGEEDE